MSGSATSAAVNLLNTIIGAGLLAMPFGIRANGVLLGLFVIMFSAASSMFGLYLQGKCSRYTKTGHASFFSLSQLTYPSLSIFFDLGIAIKCFGVGISYLVVIGDLMPKIAESIVSDDTLEKHGILLERRFWITVVMFTVVAPLSFLRKLDSLRYASMVALSSVAYLSVLVIEHFVRNDIPKEIKGKVRYLTPYSSTSMLKAFPLFVFAYTCHQNMFSLVNELKDKLSQNINRVICSAIGTAMLLYIFVGTTGYLTFGDNVTGNIIVMYPHSVSSTVGRIAIVILVTLSYPLQCHPARASINHIVHYIEVRKIEIESRANSFSSSVSRAASGVFRALSISSSNSSPSARPGPPRDNQHELTSLLVNSTAASVVIDDEADVLPSPAVVALPTKRFVILTSIIVICSYLVAIRVQGLEHVLGFVGATGSTSISFILPGIFGYKLLGSNLPQYDQDGNYIEGAKTATRKEKAVKWLAAGLSIWGVVVMVVCLTAVLFFGAGH